jgi:hypothetical protein
MNDPRLKLEMHDGEIVISLPGTSYQVTFRRLADSLGMSALHNIMDDEDAPITPVEFLERAWGVARDKAREMGWIA